MLYRYVDTLGFITLDIKCPPRESVVWGPAAQTVNGKIRVQASGFPSSAIVSLVQP
jgi:hypothetical protein